MLKILAMVPFLALVLLSAACQTSKSRSACQQDVERLKGMITETGTFLDALEPELREARLALEACKSRTRPCRADAWLVLLEERRVQESDLERRFARAVDVYQPEACLDYTAQYRLNPPAPDTYQGYFSAFEHAEEEIERLQRQFRVFDMR